MNERDHEALSNLLSERGASLSSTGEIDNFLIFTAAAHGTVPEAALEWLADLSCLIPFGLQRPSCSKRAENKLRSCGRGVLVDQPWLPFASPESLITLAHHNPAALHCWQIPRDLQLRVLVPRAQYKLLHTDIQNRLALQSLEETDPFFPPRECPKTEELLAILDWILEAIPFAAEEKERLERNRHQLMAAKAMRWWDYKVLPPGYALALHHLSTGKSAAPTSSVEMGDLTCSDIENLVEIDMVEVGKINPSSINASPEQVIHWVLARAIALRSSDLHIKKYYNMARFRGRIDGELQVIHPCPEEQLPRFIGLIKNYSNMGQRRQDAQDARFSMSLGKRRIDCHVSAIPCRKDQQKITIRFLDKLDGVKKLSELHLAPEQSEIFQKTTGRDQGLVLITGPTGSGKTTTLYALLNSINADNINIHTIEDPIEYEIEGLNQTQTDPVNQITFTEGLRRLMRADPDVILIGECRDEETANAAINAALTGHLVLTTLHANDCLCAVTRLIAMNIPPYLLADSLALTQAQRMVRKLCSFCKRPAPIDDETKLTFEINRVSIPAETVTLYEKVGCPECNGCGYSGRIALMEMCPIDPRMADLVARNAPQSEMREIALSRGVRTLYQQGLNQVLAGNTSMEEIACLCYTSLRALNSAN